MKPRTHLNINTVEELALQLGLSQDLINRVVFNFGRLYIFREKVKDKKGKERDFYEATGDLKKIHERINKRLFNALDFPSTIQGGIKGRSIKTNAVHHVGKRYVANFDIEKFFPSIKSGVVYKMFIDQKCKPDVARLLTVLTTVKGDLPQGFITSPKISGLILRRINERLTGLLQPLNLNHTFWIDDLTISGNYPTTKLKKIIETIFRQCGFKLNTQKTKVSNRRAKQVCTGLVVNSNLNADKNFRKKIRRELHICGKFGVENYLLENEISLIPEDYLASLKGRINFVCSINKNHANFQKKIVEIEADYYKVSKPQIALRAK